MAESVETGGIMRFDYSKGERPKLNDNQKKDVKEAYDQYKERKKRERTRNMIIWIVVALVIVAGILWFVF